MGAQIDLRKRRGVMVPKWCKSHLGWRFLNRQSFFLLAVVFCEYFLGVGH